MIPKIKNLDAAASLLDNQLNSALKMRQHLLIQRDKLDSEIQVYENLIKSCQTAFSDPPPKEDTPLSPESSEK